MNLDAVRVGQVMTPRTQGVAIPVGSSLADTERAMLVEGHLGLPVYEGSTDRVVGVLLDRDPWTAAAEGVADLRDVTREPTFVPESKPVEDLIREMPKWRIKMAFVPPSNGSRP